MSRTQAKATARREPVTFRMRSHLIRLVESVAEAEGVDRNTVLERWTEERLEERYPGCTEAA